MSLSCLRGMGECAMPRERGGLIAIGDAVFGLPGPGPPQSAANGTTVLHPLRSGEADCMSFQNPSSERLPVAEHGMAVRDPSHSVLRNISPTSVWRSSKRSKSSMVPSENTCPAQSVFFGLSDEQPLSVLVPLSRKIFEYGLSKFSSHSFSIPLPAIPFSLLLLMNVNAITFAEPESSLDGIAQFTHHKLR